MNEGLRHHFSLSCQIITQRWAPFEQGCVSSPTVAPLRRAHSRASPGGKGAPCRQPAADGMRPQQALPAWAVLLGVFVLRCGCHSVPSAPTGQHWQVTLPQRDPPQGMEPRRLVWGRAGDGVCSWWLGRPWAVTVGPAYRGCRWRWPVSLEGHSAGAGAVSIGE